MLLLGSSARVLATGALGLSAGAAGGSSARARGSETGLSNGCALETVAAKSKMQHEQRMIRIIGANGHEIPPRSLPCSKPQSSSAVEVADWSNFADRSEK